jgi:hypothetical protein
LAAGIFLISVSGFSFIAWMTFDAALERRFVDFPWICTSFAAIVVALLNISEAGRREQISPKRRWSSRLADVPPLHCPRCEQAIQRPIRLAQFGNICGERLLPELQLGPVNTS